MARGLSNKEPNPVPMDNPQIYTDTSPASLPSAQRGRAQYKDPGFAAALVQVVFVLGAEVALVLLLVVH